MRLVRTTGNEKSKNVAAMGERRKQYMQALKVIAMCLLIAACLPIQASAAAQVTSGLKKLQDIVAAFVSAVGALIVLWGIFEWGNAMQSQDGMMQSQAFKRIGGGIVMTLGPQLLSVILAS